MDSDRAVQQGTEEDRVVSRRVENPTQAGPGDEAAYAAADPVGRGEQTDTDSGGSGGESERAAHDLAADDESEPTRSE